MNSDDETAEDSELIHSFRVPGVPHEILIMPDPPHLLKNMRNALKTHGVFTIDKKYVEQEKLVSNQVKWEHIVKMVEFQENNRQLKICPHLSRKDIELNNFEKMRVKPATHVFSKETADGLEFCHKHYPDLFPEEVKTTIFYLRVACDYFTRMMSRKRSLAFSNDKPDELLKGFCILEWFSEFYGTLKIGKSFGQSLPTGRGIKIATKNMIKLAKFMLDQEGVIYLRPGLVSNDPIENFHSCVRNRDPIPSCLKFMRITKAICMCQCIDQAAHGSYDQDDTDCFLTDFSIAKSKQDAVEKVYNMLNENERAESVDEQSEESQDDQFAAIIHPYPEQQSQEGQKLRVEEDISERNALSYLTGYLLLKTICSKSYCEKCKEAYVSDENDDQLCNELIRLRDYKVGALCRPSSLANNMTLVAENVFRVAYEEHKFQKNVRLGDKISSKIHMQWQQQFSEAPSCHLKLLCDRFTSLRLNFNGRFMSRQLLTKEKKKIVSDSNASKSTKPLYAFK